MISEGVKFAKFLTLKLQWNRKNENEVRRVWYNEKLCNYRMTYLMDSAEKNIPNIIRYVTNTGRKRIILTILKLN